MDRPSASESPGHKLGTKLLGHTGPRSDPCPPWLSTGSVLQGPESVSHVASRRLGGAASPV